MCVSRQEGARLIWFWRRTRRCNQRRQMRQSERTVYAYQPHTHTGIHNRFCTHPHTYRHSGPLLSHTHSNTHTLQQCGDYRTNLLRYTESSLTADKERKVVPCHQIHTSSAVISRPLLIDRQVLGDTGDAVKCVFLQQTRCPWAVLFHSVTTPPPHPLTGRANTADTISQSQHLCGSLMTLNNLHPKQSDIL